jgi:hypothetical protein
MKFDTTKWAFEIHDCGAMTRLREIAATLVVHLGPLAVGTIPLLMLFWLLQPTVRANPGLSAYKAPLGTQVEPLPRKMESVEYSKLPRQVSVAGFPQDYVQPDFAQNYSEQREAENPAKRQLRVSNRKQSKGGPT